MENPRTSWLPYAKTNVPGIIEGSQYAIRDVIGSLDVIKNFKYQTIKDFYHKWYLTYLEAIAIVGDFDIKVMEQRVKDIMSKVPAIENPTPRPFFEFPSHDEIYYCLATDKEAQSSSISITTVFPEACCRKKYRCSSERQYCISLNSMISSRISERSCSKAELCHFWEGISDMPVLSEAIILITFLPQQNRIK
ncbi:MAG: insulinase family protein [Odoribacter sp.]